ncbi:uncharacterized protein LOC103576488 isoform X2 [Microplitis demolitor]|nr:uncharacterized protein LOC103576488 isoform X2 [Microplitis demolitor]XP_053593611.1 uncharacterized protein LOC103576488 isoform X2 [Microplitis demolitor]XP_053593612.1 uncharacterized protein LOC103576488 isoform X2 [Microplitis demolitor]
MTMLFKNSGPSEIERSLRKSSDSLCSEKSRDFCLPVSEEDNYHDVQSMGDSYQQIGSEICSVISEEKSLSARPFRAKSDEYFSASKQESQDVLTGREINIKMMEILPKDDFNPIDINDREFDSFNEDFSDSTEESEEEEEEVEKILPPIPMITERKKKPELNYKISGSRLEYSRRSKIKKKNNSWRISNRLNFLAKPKHQIKLNDSPSRIKMKKRKTRMKKVKSKSVESRRVSEVQKEASEEDECPINHYESVNELKEDPSMPLNIEPAVENVEIIEKLNEKWPDVVEIYHNIAAQNISPSAVSSKQHFKLDIKQNFNSKDDKHFDEAIEEFKPHEIVEQNSIRQEEYLRVDIKQNVFSHQHTHTRNQETFKHPDSRSTPMDSWCCESFSVRRYQQPTIASQLKKVNRCYFTTRFDIKNIPFVVGTSVTRSHNLGLNIQQVWSLMKNRQPEILNEIRPVLIRKVGQIFGSTMNPGSMHVENCHGNEGSIISSKQTFRQESVEHPGGRVSLKNKQYGDSIDAAHFTKSSLLRQREEQLKKSDTLISKCKSFTNDSGNVQKVLLRLQDQFEEMNKKYEKLEGKIKKLNDESVREELSKLESELNDKEEEIYAVAGLYTEVRALKQQIKMMHQKKSLLYITTESAGKLLKNSSMLSRSRTSYPLESFHRQQRPRTSCNTKPPTSSRLVGLLRHIQSVQQQLTT